MTIDVCVPGACEAAGCVATVCTGAGLRSNDEFFQRSTEVIPGVTAMSGCWSAVGVPITQGDDILSVLPGTLDEDKLAERIGSSDACVIMKVGRNLPRIRRALEAAGRLDRAIYVERGTMDNMKTSRLAEKPDDDAPYFSIVLVPGWSGRR